MPARDILKNYNLFVDGRGYAGVVTEYNAPELAVQGDEHRAGGMDAPVDIDMGMEKMEASFSLAAVDHHVMRSFGLAEGQEVPLTLRGAIESYQGGVTPVVHSMRGKIMRVAPGAWQPGQKPTMQITVSLNYFRQEIDGEVIHEIDVINMIRIINGTDQLAEQRAAIGL